MKLGFTGTRNGMSDAQMIAFTALVYELRPDEFHHGDCVGADSHAHNIVKWCAEQGDWACGVVIHPPINTKTRAFCEGAELTLPEKEYLDRDHDIVDACDILVGTPKGHEPERRGSGTWATLRYAQRNNVKYAIIWPDGSVFRSW